MHLFIGRIPGWKCHYNQGWYLLYIVYCEKGVLEKQCIHPIQPTDIFKICKGKGESEKLN